MKDKNAKALHKVEKQLVYLHSLKKDLLPKRDIWEKKYMMQETEVPDPYKSSYQTDVTFSVIQAKASETAAGLQEYDFIPMDSEWGKNLPVFKRIWDYEWITTRTDDIINKAFLSAYKYWDGYIYEWTRRIKRKIKTPDWYNEDGSIRFKEEEVIERDGIYSEYIPVQNIYHDGEDIEDANELVWVKQWDRSDYLNTFNLNPNYKNVNDWIPRGRYYYVNGSEIDVNWSLKDEETISELRYYNKSKDELIVLANGIEVYNWCIPYKHKELPFCQVVDYPVEGRAYNMWEYELLEKDEKYKDALRALSIDVVKFQFWFTAVDPEADFDENTVEIWVNSFARVSPKDVAHYAPNISNFAVREAEAKADEDIIIKSGVDYRSQILWPAETAEKTRTKKESSRKRINYMLKTNAYTFFERLARLRVSNIQLEYSSWNKKIFAKGGDIDSNWVFKASRNWYGTFTTKPDLVKGKFSIVPITDSILWVSSERELKRFLEFQQIGWNLMGEDQKPIQDNEKVYNEIAKRFWIDPTALKRSSVTNKTPESIMNQLKNKQKWVSSNPLDPNSPEYIPWAQRSWAKKNVPTIWTLSNED